MKRNKIIATVVLVAMFLGLGIYVAAYDSSSDPIISLSYLNDIFKTQVMNEVDKKISTAVGSIPANGGEDSSSSGYDIVELSTGDVLYASDACDIMLRSGTAVCVAPTATQGIADYTDATEILAGQSLIKNHMCLIPRGDGRGVVATSSSVFIMVRGAYTVVKH